MNKLGAIVLSAVLVALPVSGMAAYQAGDVKDGGSVSGTVPRRRSSTSARTRKFARRLRSSISH